MRDIVIIGAGVTGSAVARELSRYQYDVLVVEANSDVCEGTSKANSGIVHAGFDTEPGSMMAKMNIRGNEMMEQLSKDLVFSATFLPIQYYKNLLGGEKEDYEVYAHSVFDPEKRTILIAGDVTSKFSRRSQEEYYNIARYIHEVVKNRHGNYMIFFPSYSFMNHVYEIYEQYFMT